MLEQYHFCLQYSLVLHFQYPLDSQRNAMVLKHQQLFDGSSITLWQLVMQHQHIAKNVDKRNKLLIKKNPEMYYNSN